MSVDPAQVPLLLAAMASADVAIGSRSMTDSTVESHSRHRRVMGRTFNFLANAVTNVGLKDTQCGFKAFRTPVARILFHLMMIDRFAFDVEVLSLARQLGLHISEVPVEWREAPDSTVRPVSDSMSMTADVLRIRWRRKRPQIPALVVSAGGTERQAAPDLSLSDAFGAFRQTDPILSLDESRALVLLPLCGPDEIKGAAARLGQRLTNLTVRQRLVSCSELISMMPLTAGETLVGGRNVGTVTPERRSVSRSAAHFRQYPRVGARPMSTREARSMLTLEA